MAVPDFVDKDNKVFGFIPKPEKIEVVKWLVKGKDALTSLSLVVR